MDSAPFFAQIAGGPDNVSAHWLPTADGVRIRMAVWPGAQTGAGKSKGTVLIFPGRTEYAEKYAQAAGDMNARGYGAIAIDWRGQGLADRLLDDPLIGHVGSFGDYQLDVAAVVRAMSALDLPRPWYLMAHSMGGAIGLRALIDGLQVRAAVFSAPMWGILITPLLRPFAKPIGAIAERIGLGNKAVPGSGAQSYVLTAPFENNLLTTDPDMYRMLQEQAQAHPELSLAAPSFHWLHESFREMEDLRAIASPPVPTLTGLGSNERIVDPAAVRERMGRWPGGVLSLFKQAEHEIMMERPATRKLFFDKSAALFDANR